MNKPDSQNYFPNLLHLFSKEVRPVSNAHASSDAMEHKHGDVIWIDVQNPTSRSLSKLAGQYDLHELQVSQCLQRGHIAQTTPEDGYVFLTLSFPCYVADGDRIVSSQLNVFVGKKFIITTHGSGNPIFRRTFQAYQDDSRHSAKSGPEILYHYIESLLMDTATIVQNVFQELDDIEDAVFDSKTSDAYNIGQLRQKITGLRRTLANQSAVLEELGSQIGKFSEGHFKRHYQANANTSRKLHDATDEAREIVEIYKDVDFTSSTAKTNEILAVLTLLFTLTIPATVIGTFYGMNVLLPGGLEAGSWTFLGPYTMFRLIVAFSIIAAAVMYFYFKRRRWF